MKFGKCLSFPSQIINPFLNSANHNKVEQLLANGEILIKGIVSLLYNLF